MDLMGLSDDVRQQVKSYYMYIWKRLKSFSGDKDFLDDLPFKLRCDTPKLIVAQWHNIHSLDCLLGGTGRSWLCQCIRRWSAGCLFSKLLRKNSSPTWCVECRGLNLENSHSMHCRFLSFALHFVCFCPMRMLRMSFN